jgi:hypothetical protein
MGTCSLLRLDPHGPVRGWKTDRSSDETRLFEGDLHIPRYFVPARLAFGADTGYHVIRQDRRVVFGPMVSTSARILIADHTTFDEVPGDI